MFPLQTNASSKLTKLKLCISFESNYGTENHFNVILLYMVETTFSICRELFSLLDKVKFVHETSHTHLFKYKSTSGTQISICLKNIGIWGCGSEQALLCINKQLLRKYNAIEIEHYFQFMQNEKTYGEKQVSKMTHKVGTALAKIDKKWPAAAPVVL